MAAEEGSGKRPCREERCCRDDCGCACREKGPRRCSEFLRDLIGRVICVATVVFPVEGTLVEVGCGYITLVLGPDGSRPESLRKADAAAAPRSDGGVMLTYIECDKIVAVQPL